MSTQDAKRWYDWGMRDGSEGLAKTRNAGVRRDLQVAYNEGYERGARIWEHERRKRTPV